MELYIDTMINDKHTSFSLSTDNILPNAIIFPQNKTLDFKKISNISIIENIIVIVECDLNFNPVTDQTMLRKKNNISAIDWEGNYLWNISDIVGPLKIPFMSGNLWSKSQFDEFLNGSLYKYSTKSSEYTQGHSIYICNTVSCGYIIDLNDKKILYTYPCK